MLLKSNILLTVTMLILIINTYGQKLTINLTFTAKKDTSYIQLDSIKILNRTQGEEMSIYWPDTIRSLDIMPGDQLLCIGYSTGLPVSTQESLNQEKYFHVLQNYPNPIIGQTFVSVFIPEQGNVSLIIRDIRGRTLISANQFLKSGRHTFRFIPGADPVYFLTVSLNNMIQSIKILNGESGTGKICSLEYVEFNKGEPLIKETPLRKDPSLIESGIIDTPVASKTYFFQFATNIPCPGTPTIMYAGQSYNTIQIFSQCWLKENLNVGTLIPIVKEQSNNEVIEKYCYDNNPNSCNAYGGLYQWNEIMEYSTQQGIQGICPNGWHIPTDEDWKVLEGAADSQYGIGDLQWDEFGFRGFDAGINLKSIDGWEIGCNGTDLYGFSGLPGGFGSSEIGFWSVGNDGFFYTSSQFDSLFATFHALVLNFLVIERDNDPKTAGLSVRCLRDEHFR
jgi:uncharacterized protein (TIGR02145 family)